MIRRPPRSTLVPYTTLFPSDVVTVQRALGHRSPSTMLDTYSHLWPSAEDRTRAGAATLTDLVFGHPADSVWTEDTPDRKRTRLNSSHANISYAVFCL